jgi:predicted RNA-binding protein YlxR (DUF448 family)
VSSRKSKRRRHIPQRTCIGCRKVLPKRSLIRIVNGPDGVKIDPTGKAPGRGAYLHNSRSCWENAIPGSLARALRTELTDETIEELSLYMKNLADEQLD